MSRVIVYHRMFDCETGCCGHAIKLDDAELPRSFDFAHPYGDDDFKKWAEEFIARHYSAEHVKDLDWDNCQLVNGDNC